MSTFSLIPNQVSNIANSAFPKNPVINTFKSNFSFRTETIPPNTESNDAIIAIARYPVYAYDITGLLIPYNRSYYNSYYYCYKYHFASPFYYSASLANLNSNVPL